MDWTRCPLKPEHLRLHLGKWFIQLPQRQQEKEWPRNPLDDNPSFKYQPDAKVDNVSNIYFMFPHNTSFINDFAVLHFHILHISCITVINMYDC